MNYLEALYYGSNVLKSNNIESYNLDAELLLSLILNSTREELLINLKKNIKNKDFKKFKKLIFKRKKNKPIAYILKKKEFWKLNFEVNKEVLIPRPETEIIVDQVLSLTNFNSSKQIMDVGTGSGCIILSILKERPKFYGTAIDISKNAIKVAISNAKMHHLENKVKFVNIDIDKFCLNKYDFIVSNPPYINNIDLKRLDNDVRLYEPPIALKAGLDGLDIIEKLILKSKKLLKNRGKLIFEFGKNQITDVTKILRKNNFYIDEIQKDIYALPRVVISTNLN